MVHHNSYLALGDSYTIGESVPLHESFPYQTVQLLRKQKLHFHAPEIVAKTGWTSFELAEHLLHTELNEQYDFVSLLIGVNNQYRGLTQKDFRTDLEFLLHKALHFSGLKPERVILLSIPDWGCTPFAKDRDPAAIREEIDAFNKCCSNEAKKNKVHFVNITDETRTYKNNLQAMSPDLLHYSGMIHAIWAERVAEIMMAQL
ncbi:MAG: SGNH/GDSL hydrolase family protein [Sediminibacterium sp.]|nr:SGNH/GDSL hydrolase family protein [Sediminibacterium sp.]